MSFDQAKRTLKKISGVVPMKHDMCAFSCAAFTGAYSDLEACPYCSAPRAHANGQPRPTVYDDSYWPGTPVFLCIASNSRRDALSWEEAHEDLGLSQDPQRPNGGL